MSCRKSHTIGGALDSRASSRGLYFHFLSRALAHCTPMSDHESTQNAPYHYDRFAFGYARDHRGGFSPATLVFGELPRVPGELLSDDHVGLSGIADQFEDPLEVDTAAGEFRRRFHIREQAKQLAMEQTSKDAISRAVKAAPHQSRTWAPGQWVFVFRRGRPSQELHPIGLLVWAWGRCSSTSDTSRDSWP